MHLYEAMVAEYLTANGRAFICPQYEVRWDAETKTGGSSPDFLVIDFSARDIVVVEVSGASNLNGLIDKIRDRENRWYRPIKRQLIEDKVIDQSWPNIRTLVFVRQERTNDGESKIKEDDVTFVGLESAAFGYAWYEGRQSGLPNRAKNLRP